MYETLQDDSKVSGKIIGALNKIHKLKNTLR